MINIFKINIIGNNYIVIVDDFFFVDLFISYIYFFPYYIFTVDVTLREKGRKQINFTIIEKNLFCFLSIILNIYDAIYDI